MAAQNLQHMSQALRLTLSWLEMNRDYYERLQCGKVRFVLVEGKTDKRLLERNLCNDVNVCAVGEIFRSQNVFRQDYNSPFQSNRTNEQYKSTSHLVNAKLNIIEILSAFKFAGFLNAPLDASKWKVYGVVDSDYPSIEPSMPLQNLFLTDTHDIETLLLMTDKTLLMRVMNGFFSDDDVRKAYYLSYQLAKLRTVLYDNSAKLNVDMPEGQTISLWRMIRNRLHNIPDDDLALIVTDDAIDVIKAIGYVCNHVLSNDKLKRLSMAVLQDKRMKKSLDVNTGKWKKHWDTFQPEGDFYQLSQGHDIARFLRYVTKEKCSNLTLEYQNNICNIEFMLVDNYHLPCLGQSVLGKNLIKNEIWKESQSM